MSPSVLIRGGTVLALDRSVGNAAGIDVLIEDGLIAEVGPSLRARSAEVVDAADCIVMPGFVDAHRHTWHSLLRNGGAGVVADAALGARLTPDQVHAATLVGLVSAATTGTTAVADWFDMGSDRALVQAALDAHRESGLRTVLVLVGDDGPAAAAVDLEPGPLTGLAWGSTAIDDVDRVRREWEAARGLGLRIHAHAGTRSEDDGVVAALGTAGLLGPDVTLVHCTRLGEADLDAIAASGTRVVLAPVVEMTSGIGIPPVQAFVDRKIALGLGVESEIEAPGDVLAQMRAANSIQHATLFDLKLAGKGGVPNLLSTREVIRFGTTDGAGAIGLGEVTGRLKPGMAGDVVVLRADRPNIAPVNDPIGAVVWGMDPSNVDAVVVGGRTLVQDGRLVADVAAIARSAGQAAPGVRSLAAAGRDA